MDKLSRREFIKKTAIGAAGLSASAFVGNRPFSAAPYLKNPKISNKVIVLGLDGMDPNLVERFVAEGKMPTFKKLMESGHWGRLQSTMPPQSPVAWSSFITGTNPGGNGIYDFIHRDPSSFTPYLSTSRTYGTSKTFDVGKWSIPIKSGRVELLRKGPAFWTTLEENGIPASLFKLPANFPIQEGKTHGISGMGTPDILGSYGTYTFFTDTYVPNHKHATGGRVVRVRPIDHVIKSKLKGPKNSMRTDIKDTEVEFTVNRDPWEPTIKVNMQGHEVVLKQGEWSEWIPLKFEMIPMFASVSGMVRIYAQEVHPHFKLYMTPINIDPMDPILPICSPAGYSKEMADVIGRFYTQGFPEDTKALSNGIFSNDEFLAQSKIVFEERLKAFEWEFDNFKEGMFFFYFSTIDQNTHMMWRTMHPSHPLYREDATKNAKQALSYFYERMDEVLKKTLTKVDSNTTLITLSDHGFAPFEREFHLSTWLVENGFTAVTDPDRMHEGEFYRHVDWSKTKAYALGLNGIYINLEGREPKGWVNPREAEKIKQEIRAKLNNVVDPQNGRRIVTQAYDPFEIYSGPYVNMAPDIVVGYESGYRISDEAVLGKFPKEIVGDRTNLWSADHCTDPKGVPGILLTNREVEKPNPGLWDLAPSILKSFGLKAPAEMDGKPIFRT